MREKFNPLIKPFATRTDPAAERKSIGLPADAQLVSFLLSHLDNFVVTLQLCAIYRDWQKTRHLDTGGNSPNRRAFSCQRNQESTIYKNHPRYLKYTIRLRMFVT
jgi:hypothetical protein